MKFLFNFKYISIYIIAILAIYILTLAIPDLHASSPSSSLQKFTAQKYNNTHSHHKLDMKSELENVEKLIEKRELEASALPEAISKLEILSKLYKHNTYVFAQLAQAYYYSATLSSSAAKKLDDFYRGLEAAKKSTDIDPDNLEGNFWYGINLGRVASTKSDISQIKNIKEIVKSMERVLEKDPHFMAGGPYLVLGRVYLEAPGMPISIGDKEKALQYFKKALELDESYYETHYYLMEFYAVDGKMELAVAEAKWLSKSDFHNSYPISAQNIKRKAQEIIAKYRKN